MEGTKRRYMIIVFIAIAILTGSLALSGVASAANAPTGGSLGGGSSGGSGGECVQVSVSPPGANVDPFCVTGAVQDTADRVKRG